MSLQEEPTLSPDLLKAAGFVLRELMNKKVDEVNDLDVIDPETGEDPPSVKVALEIEAYDAIRGLGHRKGKEFKGAYGIGNGMRKMNLVVESLAFTDSKVLAAVALVERADRPYKLSDFAWVYVLQQVQARLVRQQERPPYENMQGYLESHLDAELKAKLRNKVGTDFVAGDIVTARAFVLEEDINVTIPMAAWEVNEPEAFKGPNRYGFANKVDAALRGFAAKLKAIDDKYGIVGVSGHAVMMKMATVSLSVDYRLAIVPVICCDRQDELLAEYPELKAVDLAADEGSPQTGSARFEGAIGGGLDAPPLPGMTLEACKEDVEAFDSRLVRNENGELVVQYDNGYQARVYTPPVAPQGVAMAPMPRNLETAAVNESVAWARETPDGNPITVEKAVKTGTEKRVANFFKSATKTSE